MKLSVPLSVGGAHPEILDLELPDGVTTVLFGPNGAGKSTLLRVLAGLGRQDGLPDPIYLQQHPYMFRGTAGHNLGLGLTSEGAAWARQLADEMGVGEILDQQARALSGGQQQRLALSRTFALPAAWILLDEPLAAIDRADRSRLMSLLARILVGRNAVVVTHDIDVVAALATHLVVMDEGRVLEQGDVGVVLGSPSGIRTAEVLGMANLIDGIAHNEHGVCVLESGPISIVGLGEATGQGRAFFGAETVTLSAVGASATSARNAWSGRVETILSQGQLIEVAVDIGVRVVALVTPGALADLALQPGSEVRVSVKASAVRIVAT